MSNDFPNERLNQFLDAKTSLITYYQNISSVQGVRLIGFSAGIFTLLSITKLRPEEHLRELFDSFSILNFGISNDIFQIINLVFLFTCTWILTFFTIRAIFRYVVYALLANELLYVKLSDAEEIKGKSIHHQISDALVEKVKQRKKDDEAKRVFILFPLHIFYSYENNEDIWKGYAWQFIFSLIAAILLLLLIW